VRLSRHSNSVEKPDDILVHPQSQSVLPALIEVAPSVVNPIDNTATFVGRQYHDFFDRQGDAAGVASWIGTITICGADPVCIPTMRINASAAFFLSGEFQETGFKLDPIAARGFRQEVRRSTYALSVPAVLKGCTAGWSRVLGVKQDPTGPLQSSTAAPAVFWSTHRLSVIRFGHGE
jgi:hypothetical protein